MSPEDPRHGHQSGYDAHRRDGEEACDRCRTAAAAYEYRRRIDGILGRTYTTHSLGTARRVQALVALGWTFRQIGEALGCGHDLPRKLAFQTDTYVRTTTAEKVSATYERMSMALPPQTTGRDRWRVGYAKSTAARYGWAPPLAWDCIDTDPAPVGLTPGDEADVDANVVERILAGDNRVRANLAERREVTRRWLESERSLAELGRLTGWKVERYVSREVAA